MDSLPACPWELLGSPPEPDCPLPGGGGEPGDDEPGSPGEPDEDEGGLLDAVESEDGLDCDEEGDEGELGDGGCELGDEALGGVALGILGGCGMVGLLALGQPASNRQAQDRPANALRCADLLAIDNIGSYHLGRIDRFAVHESGPERRFAQLAHEAIDFTAIALSVVHAL